MAEQIATFGAGCFWGVEEAFRTLSGVVKTRVGYMGGHVDHPTYEQVCTDSTGHVEVVQVTFDDNEIDYDTLVDVFFDNHNPTQLNMQGPDVGSQYRTVIFYASEDHKSKAKQKLEALQKSKRFARPIVTKIEAEQTFWDGEEYHQQYLAKRGMASCHI